MKRSKEEVMSRFAKVKEANNDGFVKIPTREEYYSDLEKKHSNKN